ncbi:unnamed protein product [Medioppia subpectinata]|uniref:Uncharacterized protein n=1 Tax=Medioppia subpectinata TaxID=1979941 RepID=A0A7R9PWM7_9ACAR|nr:unnamed protein product [Medioppia subpectinata]CAG2103062.1 unnamed protein product [Medioppia subpectinata]
MNKMIELSLKRAKKEAKNELKLLLLGTGESGKSTFLKQMRIIHKDAKLELETERKRYVPYVYHNIVVVIQAIINAMCDLDIRYDNELNYCNSKFLADIHVDYTTNHLTQLTDQTVAAIKEWWDDSGVQKCYKRRNEYKLSDSAKYYFDDIDRLSARDYTPTKQDILHVCIPTTGINEYTFELRSVRFRVVDVGRKWIHCFENVTSIIFLAALNEYDQRLVEGNNSLCEQNRMEESLALFKVLIACEYFENSSVILFLNKKDLFENKF